MKVILYGGCKDSMDLNRLECRKTFHRRKEVVEGTAVFVFEELGLEPDRLAISEVTVIPVEKPIELDDGRVIHVEPCGVVDVAVSELGAKVVEVEIDEEAIEA